MTLRILPAGLLALALVLGACGDDDSDGTSTGTSAPTTSSDAAEPGTTEAEGSDDPATAPVAVGETDLGDVLVDGEGLTLYIFTNDTDGNPTCADDCAATWPPVLVDELPEGVDGIDDGVLGVVGDGGAEGGQQLTAGGQPLYLYSGDGGPGDVNGHGVGGVWFAVGADGTPIDAEAGTGGDSGY